MAKKRRRVVRPEEDGHDEEPIFENDLVTITSTRVTVAGKRYPVRELTSVRAVEEGRPRALLALALVLHAAGLYLGITKTAGMACFGGGILLLLLFAKAKPRHWVVISTDRAETRATWS